MFSLPTPRVRRRRSVRADLASAECLEPRTLLAITSPVVNEGAAGTTTTAIFTVSYRLGPEQEVNIRYETADGTATSGDRDYAEQRATQRELA